MSPKECPRLLLFTFVGFALSTMLASFSVYSFPSFLYVSFFVFLFLTIICSIINPAIFSHELTSKKQTRIWIFAWFVMIALCVLHIHLPPMRLMVYFAFSILFLRLNISCQRKIIDGFVFALSLMLFFSAIEYVIYQLTGIGLVLGSVTRETVTEREIPFLQLPLNLIDQYNSLSRFSGLAEEPGLIGTLCGFLLFYTDYAGKNRFQFYVMLVSGILTMSLAFFVILAFFLLTRIKTVKSTIITVIVGVILSAGLFYFFQEEVETFLIERIAENTLESIDNRSSVTFDYYFKKSIKSGQIVFGTGGYIPEDVFSRISGGGYSKGIAGAKKWIYQYGLFCFVIILIAYYKIYKMRKGAKLNYEDIIFLIAFWLSFYQRETILESYTFLVYMGIPLVSKNNS